MLIAPVGFLSDHVEVTYDIDVEFRALAAKLGVAAPITEVMHAIIHLGAPAAETMRRLMARSLRSERD